jgi:hypothetical protein
MHAVEVADGQRDRLAGRARQVALYTHGLAAPARGAPSRCSLENLRFYCNDYRRPDDGVELWGQSCKYSRASLREYLQL